MSGMNQATITAKEFFAQLVETPVYVVEDNHCLTCRFWRPYNPTIEVGYCDNEKVKTMVSASYQEDDTEFFKDFGCIFHKPKP